MITQDLISVLKEHFALEWTGIHGVPHWERVRENGLRLASRTGANRRIVEAFAYIHDSCRTDEGSDPDHGLRAAQFARRLVHSGTLCLRADELAVLVQACEGHSEGGIVEDITVCTCWDADRLDLGRVGIKPEANKMCTEAAKDRAMIHWSYKRSLRPQA
jgi:uncharacterized protein